MARRILLVDDDESIREIVDLCLTEEGYEVVTVAHGEAALAVVGDYQPHLILLDLRMPVMDGWQFARDYQARPGPHAPIVAFVAALDAEQETAELGAVGVLAKPFDIEDLVQTVNRQTSPAQA